MKKTIATVLLSGLLWAMPQGQHLILGYDTNKDGVEDKREVYHLLGQDIDGVFLYKHESTYKDLNNDMQFDESERTWSIEDIKI